MFYVVTLYFDEQLHYTLCSVQSTDKFCLGIHVDLFNVARGQHKVTDRKLVAACDSYVLNTDSYLCPTEKCSVTTKAAVIGGLMTITSTEPSAVD